MSSTASCSGSWRRRRRRNAGCRVRMSWQGVLWERSPREAAAGLHLADFPFYSVLEDPHPTPVPGGRALRPCADAVAPRAKTPSADTVAEEGARGDPAMRTVIT